MKNMEIKGKNICLLIISYFFYACIDLKYIILLIFVTLNTYISARFMNKKYKKALLMGCVIVNLLIVIIFKYWNYGISLIYKVFHVRVETFSLIIPIGMSFYMLQALGYLIDVYREKLPAEKNFVVYALFVSFFPTILSGPIERSNHLLKQIQNGATFSYEKAKRGLLLIAFGLFEKILIANRLSVLIARVYADYMEYSGFTILFMAILYAIEIYVDFAGYSSIALGIARLFGFELINNFRQPYFARSISDFWRRWHISLSSWLRDYVYIPLGGSRCRKWKIYWNLLLTFMISGLWHGNGPKYLVWGAIHGIYLVLERVTSPFRNRIKEGSYINTDCWSYHFFQGLGTFLLVDFAWIVFGANNISHMYGLLNKIFLHFDLGGAILRKEFLVGMDEGRWFLLTVEIGVILAVDILHEKNISICTWLEKQNLLFRWGMYLLIAMGIFVGAIYNYGMGASSFIYTQF